MANCYFIKKHSWLQVIDLPVKEIIRNEAFAVEQKTMNCAKVSSLESFVLHGKLLIYKCTRELTVPLAHTQQDNPQHRD